MTLRACVLRGLVLASAVASSSCAREAAPAASTPTAAQTTQANARGPVAFIEDDLAGALARARAERKPLVVEAWAPWCHTCQYMRRYVFTDPALAPVADRFVWAAIDTEKEQNRDAIARFPLESWPTMWVIDPATEAPVLTWVGSATVTELRALLDDAQGAMASGPAQGEAAAALVRADRATESGNRAEAIVAYRAALAAAPRDWAKRPFVVNALSDRLKKSDPAACVELTIAEAPRMPAGTPLANVMGNALEAAADLPKASPAREHLPKLVAEAKRIVLDTSLDILADDRSSLCETLVETLSSQGDGPGSTDLARAWSAFLEGEAARAPGPGARAVFDAHRLAAYLRLGEESKAIEMLVQSERDFPGDYNPPARLAKVYLSLKQHDLALAAIERALGRVYGPRALRQLETKADILESKGDRDGAVRALRQALDVATKVPLTGSYPRLRDRLRERLERLQPAK